jgi:hypothetical protein
MDTKIQLNIYIKYLDRSQSMETCGSFDDPSGICVNMKCNLHIFLNLKLKHMLKRA